MFSQESKDLFSTFGDPIKIRKNQAIMDRRAIWRLGMRVSFILKKRMTDHLNFRNCAIPKLTSNIKNYD
jgi:hypothetical protein